MRGGKNVWLVAGKPVNPKCGLRVAGAGVCGGALVAGAGGSEMIGTLWWLT